MKITYAKQHTMFADAERKAANINMIMLDRLYGVNPISDSTLARMIELWPARYGRFAGYIGKRKAGAAQ